MAVVCINFLRTCKVRLNLPWLFKERKSTKKFIFATNIIKFQNQLIYTHPLLYCGVGCSFRLNIRIPLIFTWFMSWYFFLLHQIYHCESGDNSLLIIKVNIGEIVSCTINYNSTDGNWVTFVKRKYNTVFDLNLKILKFSKWLLEDLNKLIKLINHFILLVYTNSELLFRGIYYLGVI